MYVISDFENVENPFFQALCARNITTKSIRATTYSTFRKIGIRHDYSLLLDGTFDSSKRNFVNYITLILQIWSIMFEISQKVISVDEENSIFIMLSNRFEYYQTEVEIIATIIMFIVFQTITAIHRWSSNCNGN